MSDFCYATFAYGDKKIMCVGSTIPHVRQAMRRVALMFGCNTLAFEDVRFFGKLNSKQSREYAPDFFVVDEAEALPDLSSITPTQQGETYVQPQ